MAVHFAWLTELSHGCRHEATAAASGHAVLHTGTPEPWVQLRVHGLRRLRDRRPPGGLFYEAWRVPPDGRLEAAVSIGLFNATVSGDAVVDFVWPVKADGDGPASLTGTLLLITAQRNDGQLRPSAETVLLGVVGPEAALPAVFELRRPVAEVVPTLPEITEPDRFIPAQQSEPAETSVPVEEVSSQAELRHAPAAVPPPIAHTPAPRSAVTPVPVPAPATATAPVPGWTFTADLADIPRTCPTGHRLVNEASGALIPLLPDLRTTTANMNIQFERGQCLVTVRGAPAPATWGQDPVTRRPYNVYQAWLRRGRGDEAVSLGFFRRIHQDTYRLQYRGHMPFHAFDTLAIDAADRANATFGSGPVLYVATYRHTEPIGV